MKEKERGKKSYFASFSLRHFVFWINQQIFFGFSIYFDFFKLNSNIEIISALAKTDILLLPRTHDGTGILALQAMLSNCKVIATAGTAMDEYLEPDSYCGADVQSMTDKLQFEIDNIAKVRALQDANHYRDLVDQPQFNSQSMADSYISTWQGMLQ